MVDRARSRTSGAVGGSGGDVIITPGDAFTEDISLEIQVAESNAAPTDDPTFDITLDTADSNATPTEELGLDISGHSDENATPTDARTALIRVWLSGSAGAGVGTPANANGQNDGTLATISTAVAGAATETMTSALGTNVPSGITFSSAIYRGWVRFQTTLVTSVARLVARSIGGLFADITMFTQSTLNGDTNHLAGTFTFDLVAAGVDTLAKLQSLQIIHETTDAVAGVTPAIITVDAGAVDIEVTSI